MKLRVPFGLVALLAACDRPAAPTAPTPSSVASAATSPSDASAPVVAATPDASVDLGKDATYGDTTILVVSGGGRPMRLDGPAPDKRWTLRSKVDPTKVVGTGKLDGDYRPVAYAVETKVYVMLYFGQTGAWYGIRDIALLDEQGKLRENLVSHDFFGVTDVESKDGQFIALVGKIDNSRGATAFRLLAFDVAAAHVKDVGPAPSAPPGEPEFCKGTGAQSWVEPSGIATYQPLDEGIISFEGPKLVVTKGADSCKARATKRDKVTYDLARPDFSKMGSKSGGTL